MITKLLALLVGLLASLANAQVIPSIPDGRLYWAGDGSTANPARCSGCHGMIPGEVDVGTTSRRFSFNSGTVSSPGYMWDIDAFRSFLNLGPSTPSPHPMRTAGANEQISSNLYAYLLAVRDGSRALSMAEFPDTAQSRSSERTFQATILNFRSDAMTYVVTIDGDFALVSGSTILTNITRTCNGATSAGVPEPCQVNGTIRFTPGALSPSPRIATLQGRPTWTSTPTSPAPATFAISGNAVDAFVISEPVGGSRSFTTSAASTTVTASVRITDNVGDELRACLADGLAPFNGISNYSISGAGGTIAGQCITFPAVIGVSPGSLARPLTVNIVFAPGTTTTALNARLNLQRYVGATTAGQFKEVLLVGNNGPVIEVDTQQLFTSTSIDVDGTPSSADLGVPIKSRGNEALTFSTSPPPFRITPGVLLGGRCQAVADTSTTTIADYSIVAGGCAARLRLDAYSGLPSAANECTLTVRFDATAVGPRCGLLTIHSNVATQTVVLEGSGFLGQRPAVYEGTSQQASGTVVNFTTQRLIGAVYPPRTLSLRNAGTVGDLEVVLPAIDALPGFSIARSGSCGALAPFDAGTAAPQCQIAVSFVPTEVRSYAASFDILTRPAGSSTAYGVFRVNLTGVGSNTAPALRWIDAGGNVVTSLAFTKEASVPCTTTCERSVLLRNDGPGSARIDLVNAVGLDGTSWSARLDGCTTGQFVPQGGSCGVVVTFNPSTAGIKTATLQAATTGNGPPTLMLTGTASAASPAPQLALSQTAPFATTRVGTRSAPVDVRLTNTGGFALSVTGWSLSGPFSVVSTSCPAFPFVLEASSGCIATLLFEAAAIGAASGAFEVRTNASATAEILPLNGNGESAANTSSGGCTVTNGDSLFDPTLWILVALAVAALLSRRHLRRQKRCMQSRPQGPA